MSETRPHCVRRGHSSPTKVAQQPPFLAMSTVATVAHLSYCWALVSGFCMLIASWPASIAVFSRWIARVQGSSLAHVIFLSHFTLYLIVLDYGFYSEPQCSHCKRCTSYSNSVHLSVRLSVTHRYCVKTTARNVVQFALSDSKMCLFF